MTPALVACYARDKVILGEIGMRPSEWIKKLFREISGTDSSAGIKLLAVLRN